MTYIHIRGPRPSRLFRVVDTLSSRATNNIHSFVCLLLYGNLSRKGRVNNNSVEQTQGSEIGRIINDITPSASSVKHWFSITIYTETRHGFFSVATFCVHLLTVLTNFPSSSFRGTSFSFLLSIGLTWRKNLNVLVFFPFDDPWWRVSDGVTVRDGHRRHDDH